MNNLPRVAARRCTGRELNPQPIDRESNALATTLPNHHQFWPYKTELNHTSLFISEFASPNLLCHNQFNSMHIHEYDTKHEQQTLTINREELYRTRIETVTSRVCRLKCSQQISKVTVHRVGRHITDSVDVVLVTGITAQLCRSNHIHARHHQNDINYTINSSTYLLIPSFIIQFSQHLILTVLTSSTLLHCAKKPSSSNMCEPNNQHDTRDMTLPAISRWCSVTTMS